MTFLWKLFEKIDFLDCCIWKSSLLAILLGEENNELIYFMKILVLSFCWATLDVAVVGEK